MTNLEELKKLAERAVAYPNPDWDATVCAIRFNHSVLPTSLAHIAAANPQTVLALIRELEDMKHDLERSIATSADLATELEEARLQLAIKRGTKAWAGAPDSFLEDLRGNSEPTGEMWSAGRSTFLTYAKRYEDAKTSEDASIVGDVAPMEIYRAMQSARQQQG